MKKSFLASAASLALIIGGVAVAQTNTPSNSATPAQPGSPAATGGQSREQGQRGRDETTTPRRSGQPSDAAQKEPASQQTAPGGNRGGTAQSSGDAKSGRSSEAEGTQTPPSGQQPAARPANRAQGESRPAPTAGEGASQRRPATAQEQRRTPPDSTQRRPDSAEQQRTGSSPSSSPSTAPSSAQGSAQPASGAQPATGGQTRDTATTTTGGQASASVTTEQRSKLQEAFTREKLDSARVNVNVRLDIGTSVPRNIRPRPLPSSLVSIVPQYRGYNYVVVEDEVVIIEPRTRRVVTVIERSGAPRATGSVASGSRISLSPGQRQVIRQRLSTRPGATSTEISLSEGVLLPETVTIVEMPETIVTEIPELRTYQYVMVGNRIGLVEPQSRRVIEIIE